MDGATRGDRRLAISDGMIVIAATAVGLAWASQAWPAVGPEAAAGSSLWLRVVLGVALAVPLLIAWTAALVVLRVRGPRRSWRRVARGAGMTAVLAATVSLSVLVPALAAMAVAQSRKTSSLEEWRRELPAMLLGFAGMAVVPAGFVVLMAWSVQAIQGRWRCERHWIDRAGRGLGALWIVAGGILGMTMLQELWF